MSATSTIRANGKGSRSRLLGLPSMRKHHGRDCERTPLKKFITREEDMSMDKVNWFDYSGGGCRGCVFPYFRIYESNGQLALFILDDRPESIPIKSVRQGKIKAKKYLDNKLYELYRA